MSQLNLRIKPPMMEMTEELITKPISWRKAIILTGEIGCRDNEAAADAFGMKPEAWSRFKTDKSAGVNPDKIEAFMDNCGNELLLHNLAYRRGYYLNERETETQRQLRLEREARIKAETERDLYLNALRGRVAA